MRTIEPNDKITISSARRLAENLISEYNKYSALYIKLEKNYDISYAQKIQEKQELQRKLGVIVFDSFNEPGKYFIQFIDIFFNFHYSSLLNFDFFYLF